MTADTEFLQDVEQAIRLEEWVRAVNEHGGFGPWALAVSWTPSDVKDLLKRHGST